MKQTFSSSKAFHEEQSADPGEDGGDGEEAGGRKTCDWVRAKGEKMQIAEEMQKKQWQQQQQPRQYEK